MVLTAPELKLSRKWAAEQERIAKLCVDSDQLEWTVYGKFVSGLRRVGGVDVSFFPDGIHAVAAVVVLSFPDLEVLYERCATFKLDVPYICGFLAFREVPALKAMLEAVPADMQPQVVLVDGNGVFHPRRCGSATHLGIVTGLPTIGVAKDVMQVGDVNTSAARKVAEALTGPSDWAPLVKNHLDSSQEDGNGEPLAALLRPCEGKKTVVVSTGHRVSLNTAVTLTSILCLHSVPEPIRQADLRSRAAVKAWFEGTALKTLKLPRQKAGQALLAMSNGLLDAESGDVHAQPKDHEPQGKPGQHGHAACERRGRGQKRKSEMVWRVKASPANATLENDASTGADIDKNMLLATGLADAPSGSSTLEASAELARAEVSTKDSWCLWHIFQLSLCGLCVCRK